MLIRHTNRDKIRILKYCIQKTSDGRNPLAFVLLREHYSVAKQDGEKEEDTPVSWGILNGIARGTGLLIFLKISRYIQDANVLGRSSSVSLI